MGLFYNFSNTHTCLISEGKTYGICSFVIFLLFHIVYIYRYSCLSWKEFMFGQKFFFCPRFFKTKEYRVIWSGKHFLYLGGKFLIYQKRVGYYQKGVCTKLYQALFVILQERKENWMSIRTGYWTFPFSWGGSRTVATSKMELFVIIVDGF